MAHRWSLVRAIHHHTTIADMSRSPTLLKLYWTDLEGVMTMISGRSILLGFKLVCKAFARGNGVLSDSIDPILRRFPDVFGELR